MGASNRTARNSSLSRWESNSWNASNRTDRNSSLRRWESNSWNASNRIARDFNSTARRSTQSNGTNGTKLCVCETSNGTIIRGVMKEEEEDPASQEAQEG